MARYKVLGFIPEEQESNEQVLTEGEQKQEGNVVYETDDEVQARQIHTQGGFTGPDGRWVVVTGIRDSDAEPESGITPKPPLEK